MDPGWQQFLEVQGARFAGGEAAHFGDTVTERTGSATHLIPLTHFSLIRAVGDEAAVFLHNLFTNDVQQLAVARAELNGFCSPKGRLLADFLIWRGGPGEYCLRLSADIQPAMLKKLGMYVLRSKVRLQDGASDSVLLGLAGPRAADAMSALGAQPPAQNFDVVHFSSGTVVRLDATRFQVCVRREAAEAAWQTLARHAQPAGTPLWRSLDIAAGLPHIVAATQEEFVPQMVNYELIGGVSFTKGCYPGQEIVARTRYLGKVKRRMYRVHVDDGDCPAPGTDLYSPEFGDQSCGKVVNSAPGANGGAMLLASMVITSAQAGDVRVGAPGGNRLTFDTLPYALD